MKSQSPNDLEHVLKRRELEKERESLAEQMISCSMFLNVEQMRPENVPKNLHRVRSNGIRPKLPPRTASFNPFSTVLNHPSFLVRRNPCFSFLCEFGKMALCSPSAWHVILFLCSSSSPFFSPVRIFVVQMEGKQRDRGNSISRLLSAADDEWQTQHFPPPFRTDFVGPDAMRTIFVVELTKPEAGLQKESPNLFFCPFKAVE